MAFKLTTRIFRAGGFTKDFLYLRGFRHILRMFAAGKRLNNLLIGNTSLEYHDTITELVDRNILLPPRYHTKAFDMTPPDQPILDYIVSGIRG